MEKSAWGGWIRIVFRKENNTLMSVNSKLYFVRKYNFPDESIKDVSASEIVAMFDIGAFGYDKWE